MSKDKQKIRERAYKIMSYQIWKALRLIHSRYDPVRKEVLEAAKVIEYQEKKDGTVGKRYLTFYKCRECKDLFKKSGVHVDHIKPAGAYPRYPDDLDNGYFIKWFKSLFCEAKNLQVLCVDCHKRKTKSEKGKA